jgi:hypothetical protein
MYRKRDRNQLTLENFNMPFGGKLKADNRWVKLAAMMPWDFIEDIYAESMSEEKGGGAISSRIAFGAITIKENENLTDRSTVEYISENPYMQYFLGLQEFQDAPLFDPSMMTHFRKRFPADKIEEINKLIFAIQQNDSDDDSEPPKNKGKLVLDATCAPADIRYPSDLSLLNEARENTEKIIDELFEKHEKTGRRTGYSRKKARSKYLSVAKQKRPKATRMKAAKIKQIQYIESNMKTIIEILLEAGMADFPEKRLQRLLTIRELLIQQKEMISNSTRSCEHRIVSLRQPHVRPIVRGKAGRRYEFGQKLAFSVINGTTFIEKQSFDNFNEGITLIDSVKRYKERFGFYPEAVIADQIYRNKENMDFCKLHGIRITGAKLAKPDMPLQEGLDPLEYQDYCERNIVEGRIGTSKRRFGLDLIMCYLPGTALTEGALQVLCMNFSLWLRFLFSLFCLLLESAFPRLQGYFSSPVSSC